MSEDSENTNDLIEEIWAQIEDCESLASLSVLLASSSAKAHDLGDKGLLILLERGFQFASELTESDTSVARQLLLDRLLPICLENPRSPTDEVKRISRRLRSLLSDWIKSFPIEQREELRNSIFQRTSQRIRSQPTETAFYLISAIGYRDESIVKFLWGIAKENSDYSDVALSTIISLGVDHEDRTKVFELIDAQLESGYISRNATYAVQELAGPSHMKTAKLLLKVNAAQSENYLQKALALSSVSMAVDRCANENKIHQEIWHAFRNHYDVIMMNSEFAYGCNTADTVVDYFQWLAKGAVADDSDIGMHSVHGRLSELVKPRQLEGYSHAATEEVLSALQQKAKQDTEITGRYATVKSFSKEAAWDCLARLGASQLEDLIDVAILNEANSGVAYEIADIISSMPIKHLSPRFCGELQTTTLSEIDNNANLSRQLALTKIAHASGTREAFDAMINFHFLNEGKVLLATVDAIVGLALARLECGDAGIIESLLQMVKRESKKHHRQAGLSVLCRLLMLGKVDKRHHRFAWEILHDESLDAFAHQEAMEAIGWSDIELVDGQIEEVRQLAIENATEVGWRACESLIRRDWLTPDDESFLFERLGIEGSKAVACRVDPSSIDNWQSYLIGLLFEQFPDRFQQVVCEVLRYAPFGTVYQLISIVRRTGSDCANAVSDALVTRVISSNDRYRTDTGLFDVLGAAAPTKLLSLADAVNWRNWMVEARYSYCEAIIKVGIDDIEHGESVSSLMIKFIQDAAIQVRRSGYRGLGLINPDNLLALCKTWSQATDPELSKRAAEALSWIPSHTCGDEELEELGLAWHRLDEVREIAKRAIVERRNRNWSIEYLKDIQSAAEENRTNSEAYCKSRAIEKLGDDQTIHHLECLLQEKQLKTHVRFWLQRAIKALKKEWKKRTAKWPEPWAHESGTLESVHGEFHGSEGDVIEARVLLWRKQRHTQSERYSWGGIAEEIAGGLPLVLDEDELTLKIPNRPPRLVGVSGRRWGSEKKSRLTFFGNSAYPEQESTGEIEQH